MASQAVMYHSVLPQNNADLYRANQQVEWVIDIPPGRAMKAGTLSIQYDLRVNSTGTTRNTGTVLGYDHLVGGHGVWQSWQSSASNGMIESIQNYPRYVKMVNETTMGRKDVFSQMNQAELIMPNFAHTTSITAGMSIPNLNQTSLVRDYDCNIEPKICLNKTLTDVSPQKTGRINLVGILERDNGFLSGVGVLDACNYSISNVELHYVSVPDKSKPSDKLTWFIVSSQKNTLQSQRSNITCVVPDVITSVFGSFIEQNDEFSNIPNNTKTSVLKSITSIKFLMNDSQSNNIVYEQETYDEIEKNYAQTMRNSISNEINNSILGVNNGFGVGQNFSGSGLNLLNNKLDVEIITSGALGISNTNAYTFFVYFNGLIQV